MEIFKYISTPHVVETEGRPVGVGGGSTLGFVPAKSLEQGHLKDILHAGL